MNAWSRLFRSASISLVVTAVLVTRPVGQVLSATSLTVLSKDGRHPLAISIVNEQEFVALDDLAGLFQLGIHEDSTGAITVAYKGKTIVLTPDQALASVAGRLVSLPAAPSRVGRRWLVPVEFVSRVLALVYDARLDLRSGSHLLIVGDLRVPHVTARYDLYGNGGQLTIDATPRATGTITQESDRLLVKFDADALDIAVGSLPAPGPQNLVQAVRIADQTSLAVELGQRFAGFRSSAQPIDTTMRLVIDLMAQADTSAAPPPPAPPVAQLPPALDSSTPSIRTIAIDPGHGGDDWGARGADGTKEKDLTLAVARHIKALIESRLGIRVLLTRDDDTNVPIDDRTAVANNNKADLMVSLHANASLRLSTTGASIYYAAFDERTVKAAGESRTAEHLATFDGGSRDIGLVLWNLAQTRHVDQSMYFSVLLEQQLRDRVPLAPRSLGPAPLRVLESANMPAVLIEMGFLTNPEQEKQLAGQEFQDAFAQALFDAIVRFRDSLPTGVAR